MANNKMLMPLQIERQYGESLDSDYAFDTLDELKNYATTSALSYSGQILYCKENDVLYKVDSDKTSITPLAVEGIGSGISEKLTKEDADETYANLLGNL